MKYKKFLVSIIFLLGIGILGLQGQTLYLKDNGGIQTGYILSNISKISFSAGNILVRKISGTTNSFSLTGLRYLNFIDLTNEISTIENPSDKTSILLYPNPSNDILNIKLLSADNHVFSIEIISVDGKVAYKEAIIMQTKYYKINVSNLPKGLYVCIIKNSNNTFEKAIFVKQ